MAYEQQAALFEFQDKASSLLDQSGFRVVVVGEPGYDKAKEIANTRFSDLKPLAIAFPRTANHVAECIKKCMEMGIGFRLRSGGHNNEGMSSSNDVMVIRMSEFNQIEYKDERRKAWIGAGAKLESVYHVLARYGKIIPGGGCESVCIGGLVLGGGFGLSARMYGLACDNVEAIEVVKANGDVLIVSAAPLGAEYGQQKNHHPRLFRALLGGGGGNFCVATRFLFKLRDFGQHASMVRLFWEQKDMKVVLNQWLKHKDELPSSITSGMRLNVSKETVDNEKYPVYLFARMYGELADLEVEMGKLKLPTPKKKKTSDLSLPYGSSERAFSDLIENYSFQNFESYEIDLAEGASSKGVQQDGWPEPPKRNCLSPHAHKVTSAYEKNAGNYTGLAEKVVEFVTGISVADVRVNKYISLYALGGAMEKGSEEKSVFAYRDKKLLMQIQAWWNRPETAKESEEKKFVNWVSRFRQHLEGHIEGAFTNFVDRYIGSKNGKPTPREELLKHYFRTDENGKSERLEFLKAVKMKHDPDDDFRFEMSIPGAK